ncbi:MAG: ferredoxin:protochlorophyllide reductase (ATP-dependent) subunit B [Burkholderiales bacterium]|nr:ferredoxin:protochlorophyllide reductase (ATP-dependent) subunit B [Burkholderiales bacterium]
MQLSLWTYEGPPHVGAMRIATSMRGVHYVLHAPQGDTYADLLFTMIERRDQRPPVTYTTFQARDLGGDTAELLKTAVAEAFARHQPEVLLVGESCTAELIQDQAGALAASMNLPIPVVPLELPSYSKKENWGASETFYHLVRALLPATSTREPNATHRAAQPVRRPRANILGPTLLGFRCRDDVTEIRRLLDRLGVDVNVVAPLDATPANIRTLLDADFNIDLYPEISRTTCSWLKRAHGMPMTSVVPIGIGATRDFIEEVALLAGLDATALLDREQPGRSGMGASASRLAWYSRSVDSTYLTGKRVFIFADGTHAVAAARVAREELGFEVVGLGTYAREMARDVRDAAQKMGLEALISDDHLEVEDAIRAAAPDLVLGTQMERHIAKRLGVPCAVISSPIHVQDVPARFSPVMGFEGANVLFDSWIHPLMMGLEEHLLAMFREDFEFHGDATASHLGHGRPVVAAEPVAVVEAPAPQPGEPVWNGEAEAELKKIPFFVRGKARRNTEAFARERGLATISLETLYDAKAHFGR